DLINPVVRHCRGRLVPAFPWVPRCSLIDVPLGRVGGLQGVLIHDVPSSLAEGRDKTRTPAKPLRYRKPEGSGRDKGIGAGSISTRCIRAQRDAFGLAAATGDELNDLGAFGGGGGYRGRFCRRLGVHRGCGARWWVCVERPADPTLCQPEIRSCEC